jgi:hypothetical protein
VIARAIIMEGLVKSVPAVSSSDMASFKVNPS